jgi:hypothetical protein
MFGTPTKSYKNSEGRTVFCWDKKDTVIVSLSRLDKVDDGKYKEVTKKEANSFLNKLGIFENHVQEIVKPVEKQYTPTKSSVYYNANVDLTQLKEERNNSINSKLKGKGVSSTGVRSESFMNELALISGATSKLTISAPPKPVSVIKESNTIKQQDSELESLFNSDVKIVKKNLSSAGTEVVTSKNKLKYDNEIKDVTLTEGSNDRVMLCTMSAGSEKIKDLGWIKIDNIPEIKEEGEVNSYKLKLQSYIEAKILEDLPRLRQIPELANKEKQTYAELEGSVKPSEEDGQQTGGEDMMGLDALSSEGQAGAEAPTPAGGELETNTAAVDAGAQATV